MQVPLAEPFTRFAEIFARATVAHPKDPNACVLATVSSGGVPSARVVLLKSFDERGFVIFTNLKSRKGQELVGQHLASLCFYWSELDEQVRVEGQAEVVSDEEADAYFATRPRESQIGAWASPQSQPIASRDELLARVKDTEARFEGGPVPRPPHWSGARIVPSRIELWKAMPGRLHHRMLYARTAAGWDTTLLSP